MWGKRILVVGAGFGGLYAAMGLRRAVELGHHVTVVNPENFMQYQPFLPRWRRARSACRRRPAPQGAPPL